MSEREGKVGVPSFVFIYSLTTAPVYRCSCIILRSSICV